MSKAPRRRLYAKLNSFGWREGWQNIVFFAPFLMAILSLLLVLAIPRLLPPEWLTGERGTGTVVEQNHGGPN